MFNEVNELKLVLHEITDIHGALKADPHFTASLNDRIIEQLARAREILTELDELLNESLALKRSERWKLIRAKTRANRLHGKLKHIRKSLRDSLTLYMTIAT